MNQSVSSLPEKDIQYQLHPYTNARLHQELGPLIIERGEGIYVYDDQGKGYIEAMAGLWSAALGFSNQRLIKAAEQQFN
ncbi:UNVERIFIED_CONTAM: aminotransferase class III-fold pyridoxal phosphate-dependent enzyme, partial [Pseudomonas aeruginosa]